MNSLLDMNDHIKSREKASELSFTSNGGELTESEAEERNFDTLLQSTDAPAERKKLQEISKFISSNIKDINMGLPRKLAFCVEDCEKLYDYKKCARDLAKLDCRDVQEVKLMYQQFDECHLEIRIKQLLKHIDVLKIMKSGKAVLRRDVQRNCSKKVQLIKDNIRKAYEYKMNLFLMVGRYENKFNSFIRRCEHSCERYKSLYNALDKDNRETKKQEAVELYRQAKAEKKRRSNCRRSIVKQSFDPLSTTDSGEDSDSGTERERAIIVRQRQVVERHRRQQVILLRRRQHQEALEAAMVDAALELEDAQAYEDSQAAQAAAAPADESAFYTSGLTTPPPQPNYSFSSSRKSIKQIRRSKRIATRMNKMYYDF